jgi:D-lactate dehydrogenase
MKIAFFALNEPDKQEYYRQSIQGHELFFFPTLSEHELPEQRDFDIISVFVDIPVPASIIDAFPNLKLIVTRSTGFDHVDGAHAKEKGILVSNVPAYGTHTVAEFAFGFILSLARKIPHALNRVNVEKRFSYEGLRGFELFEKTLGVIGTGKIGANVIRMAKGFDMKVIAYDAYPNHDLANQLGYEYRELNDVLANSDIVTIHCPYNPSTHHLINSENIFQMKRGAYLVNTARGAIIETDALLKALQNDHLAGVAMDVLEEEQIFKMDKPGDLNNIPDDKIKTIMEEYALTYNPKVLFTPHMAFFTEEGERAIMDTTSDNIHSFVFGNAKNVVN